VVVMVGMAVEAGGAGRECEAFGWGLYVAYGAVAFVGEAKVD